MIYFGSLGLDLSDMVLDTLLCLSMLDVVSSMIAEDCTPVNYYKPMLLTAYGDLIPFQTGNSWSILYFWAAPYFGWTIATEIITIATEIITKLDYLNSTYTEYLDRIDLWVQALVE